MTSARRLRRVLLPVALIGYVLFVLILTLTPRMPASSTVSSVVNRALKATHDAGHARWVDFLFVEFVGNILLFVPVGILTALVVDRRRCWVVLTAGTMLSVFVELMQLLILPTRFSEVRDVASNTIGYLLGVAAVSLMRTIRTRWWTDRYDRVGRPDDGDGQ